MADPLAKQLTALLERSKEPSWNTPLSDELSPLFDAFLPSQPIDVRSEAYIVLSAISQRIRDRASVDGKVQADTATEALRRAFGPAVSSRLSETEEVEVLKAISFLAALFEVDWQSASSILQEDGILDSITDAPDVFTTSSDIARAVAQILGHASGHKACRPLITPQHRQWLEASSRQSHDEHLRAAAAVALIKYSRGSSADASEVPGTQPEVSRRDDEEFVKLTINLIKVSSDHSALRDAVEGLAYLSTDPVVKETLSSDENFMLRLFAIIPHRKRYTEQLQEDDFMSPLYGVVVIICNICAYPPRLTEEQSQIAKLRRMAKGADGELQGSADRSVLEDHDHVKARGRHLIKCGVLDILPAATKSTDSHAVRSTIGRIYLSLAEDVESRGKILQTGGAKALMLIIQGFLPSPTSSQRSAELNVTDLDPIQALAKLAITASPVQVFGPDQGAIYDAIRPFNVMLIHSSSSLLQRFEAIMALTNLASHSQEVATRIARADGLLNQVELLMLEDHVLVRRAATELICNLVCGCEDVFDRYGGALSSASKSRLQILVALCDVDDIATRLAASGALATLTSSPDACQAMVELQGERQRVLPILGSLIDPSVVLVPSENSGIDEGEGETSTHPGLAHRGVVCVRNLFGNIQDPTQQGEIAQQADRIGITKALINALNLCGGDSSAPIFVPASEALIWLTRNGVKA